MPRIPVDPQSITAEWLSEVLDADVRVCKLEQIGIGYGVLGRLYRARLIGGPGVPESVVVKLPTLDSTTRTNLCEDLDLYLSEVRFYQEIGVDNPLPPAHPYYAAINESTHDFVLVLEDLGRLRNADQTVGCTAADAEIVVEAIARHHMHWWESARLGSLPWLKTYTTPPYPAVLADNYEAAWPKFLDYLGAEVSAVMRAYGDRFQTLIPWFAHEISRPPHTFLHGDLRLDQLFFAVGPDDPPLKALDWQVASQGRAAYDVAYFLSQSLTPDTRRGCENQLVEKYATRLAAHGIDYSTDEFWYDYRLTTAWCFLYPVMVAGRVNVANDRQLELARTMFNRAAAAIEDHGCLALRPD
ncbi:phosphotransferase [Mycobacterium sp. GA-1199]|uniref:phosphotransferase n=1 Tax=Mycobacterium sp. GA-1199 TaxID=1772287 RepID=UPI000745F5E5|nr:phosphotransferase [Mycobacterium sp. GA-1199]KUI40635.1 phosphotransferase [Mycobacterium sp. GA-1199]